MISLKNTLSMSEPISDTIPNQETSHKTSEVIPKKETELSPTLQKHGMRKRGLSRRRFIQIAAAGLTVAATEPTLQSLGFGSADTATAHAAVSVPQEAIRTTVEEAQNPDSLAELARNAGKTVGVDFTGWSFNNPKWREIVSKEFNVGVIEHGLHWSDIEPEQGKLDFSIADKQVKFGKTNNMILRGQAVLWPSEKFLPAWLKNGSFSAQEMENIIRNHISTVMTRYSGEADPGLKIDEWVVVNEPYKAPLRVRKDDIFFDKLGKDYVRIAFDEAKKTNPTAKLILNDNSNHSSSEFNFVNLDKEIIQNLKAAGLVDSNFALGIQGHLKGSTPLPSDITTTLKSYGVNLMLTECDIDMSDVSGTLQQRNSFQAERLTQFLEAIEASGVCNDYTFWGIGDNNNWLEKGGKPDADPTMYDDDLNPKPALEATKTFFSNIGPQ